MEFEKLIAGRYSVRKFIPEHLSQEIVDKIIKASHLAPTGCNFQPQRILVLNSDESAAKLKECTKCHFDAPSAFVVCANTDESWKRPYDGALSAISDANIVATYMMLAAHNEGIGCCWVMHFNPEALREKFAVPENFVPVCILVMGKEAEDYLPNKLHSEYRPIEEVVYYDNFSQE